MARTTVKKDVVKRRSIEFVLEMPEAQQVILMGDFNQWNPKTHPMRKDENGVWRKTVMIYPAAMNTASGLMGSGTTTPATR